MKKRIEEIDQSNELATLAISRTKNSIRRMRLEYSILLERLEQNAVDLPDNYEEMFAPPSPSMDINDEKTLKGPALKRQKRSKADEPNSGDSKTRIRDPNLPKRPTNAYLIFCELEKARMKQSTGDSTLSTVTDLGRSLIEAWKNLDDESRKPYHKIYEEDRERYRREMMAYKKNKGRLKVNVGDEPDVDLEQDAEDQEPEYPEYSEVHEAENEVDEGADKQSDQYNKDDADQDDAEEENTEDKNPSTNIKTKPEEVGQENSKSNDNMDVDEQGPIEENNQAKPEIKQETSNAVTQANEMNQDNSHIEPEQEKQ